MKQCSHCKKLLPLTQYTTDKSKWDGLYGFCKECAKQKDKRFYENHKEQVCSRVKQYKNKIGRTYNPAYYSSEKSKLKKRNRDIKRRNLIKNANKQATITKTVIQKVFDIYHGKCAYCGVDCSNKYHIDHKIPLCKGGGNEISNLALSCPQCNWEKGLKTDIDYCGRSV